MPASADVEYLISGVVLMRHHDRHPALHHHGLGKLQLTEGSLRLLVEPEDREVAAAGYSDITIGRSLSTDEFGTILFVDFPDSQWTIDFATVGREGFFHNADGSLNSEKLFEYQLHLTVEDMEAGLKSCKEFVEVVVAAGVRVSDDSDWFEHMLAKWRAREVCWDEGLGWPTGGAH